MAFAAIKKSHENKNSAATLKFDMTPSMAAEFSERHFKAVHGLATCVFDKEGEAKYACPECNTAMFTKWKQCRQHLQNAHHVAFKYEWEESKAEQAARMGADSTPYVIISGPRVRVEAAHQALADMDIDTWKDQKVISNQIQRKPEQRQEPHEDSVWSKIRSIIAEAKLSTAMRKQVAAAISESIVTDGRLGARGCDQDNWLEFADAIWEWADPGCDEAAELELAPAPRAFALVVQAGQLGLGHFDHDPLSCNRRVAGAT